jgi:putative IMPACT (imprinted ancient) family translation regulator
MAEVNDFRSAVLSDKRVARATHNIFAYRFTDVVGLVHHDCDDDGETAAGSRLAETLRLMGVNNVAVIVTRWFGGVLLGPDRFKYICNSARNLLESNGIPDSLKVSKHKK